MTAGPGGYDPQQGWQTPPQYPGGYGPTPSWPGHGPQPAPPRPDTVRFGVGAFVANLILGLVGAIITFASIDSIIDDALTEAGVDVGESGVSPGLSPDAIEVALVIGAVVALVFVGLEVLFLWFAWNGRNWARIVLFVLGALTVFGGLSALAQPTTGFLTALSVCQMLLAIAGIVLLSRRPSGEWYRAMGQRRAAAQGR